MTSNKCDIIFAACGNGPNRKLLSMANRKEPKVVSESDYKGYGRADTGVHFMNGPSLSLGRLNTRRIPPLIVTTNDPSNILIRLVISGTNIPAEAISLSIIAVEALFLSIQDTSRSACNTSDRAGHSKISAPVKRASTRVKVPSVQLDGSAPQTVPTASPRGGVGSRHGVEPAGRNEPMNHTAMSLERSLPAAEPLDFGRRPKSSSQTNRRGWGNGPAGSAWATCREVTLG
jgi:hypothetical protein